MNLLQKLFGGSQNDNQITTRRKHQRWDPRYATPDFSCAASNYRQPNLFSLSNHLTSEKLNQLEEYAENTTISYRNSTFSCYFLPPWRGAKAQDVADLIEELDRAYDKGDQNGGQKLLTEKTIRGWISLNGSNPIINDRQPRRFSNEFITYTMNGSDKFFEHFGRSYPITLLFASEY